MVGPEEEEVEEEAEVVVVVVAGARPVGTAACWDRGWNGGTMGLDPALSSPLLSPLLSCCAGLARVGCPLAPALALPADAAAAAAAAAASASNSKPGAGMPRKMSPAEKPLDTCTPPSTYMCRGREPDTPVEPTEGRHTCTPGFNSPMGALLSAPPSPLE